MRVFFSICSSTTAHEVTYFPVRGGSDCGQADSPAQKLVDKMFCWRLVNIWFAGDDVE